MHDVIPSSVRTPSSLLPFPTWMLRLVRGLALTLALPALASAEPLAGRVVGPDGRPVAAASVVVSAGAAAPLTTSTDADGRFVLDVPAGAVEVRAFAPGMDTPSVRVDGTRTDLRLTLAVRAVSETVVVTGTPVEAFVSSRPDSVSVLTREDLDRTQTITLGDALRLVPGFVVARSGGPGTVTSVFSRGGESDFTLVLVDGVRANAFGGGMDLSQVPVAGAARVEVVRGPQSAIYGADAIGGVVNVITDRRGGSMVAATADVGSRAARIGSATLSGGTKASRGTIVASHQQERGYTGVAAADGSRVTNDDSALTHASASGGWRDARGVDVSAVAQYVGGDRGTPGPFGANPAGNFPGVDRNARTTTRRRAGAVRAVLPIGGAASGTRASVDGDAADFDLDFRGTFPSRGSTRRSHGRAQIDVGVWRAFGGSVGVDAVGESGSSSYIVTTGGSPAPVRRTAVAAYVEGRWHASDRLAITSGLRTERLTRGALGADLHAFTPRLAFPASTVVAVNPKVTATWLVNDASDPRGASTRLRASAGTGIRPPDAFEIAFTDNTGLRPERSRSVEVGLAQTWVGGTVHADLALFSNHYDDLIIAVGRFGRASRFRTDNIANARARGAELQLAWRPVASLRAHAHYTWLDAAVLAVDRAGGEAPPPFEVGDPLLRRPRHQGGVDVTWQRARLQLFTTATLRGRTLDVEPNFGAFGGVFTNPGFALLNVGGAWALTPRVALQARAVNALDARYEDVLGYPALGRAVYVGLRVAPRR